MDSEGGIVVSWELAGTSGTRGEETVVLFARVWTLGFAFTLLLRVLNYRKYCT